MDRLSLFVLLLPVQSYYPEGDRAMALTPFFTTMVFTDKAVNQRMDVWENYVGNENGGEKRVIGNWLIR